MIIDFENHIFMPEQIDNTPSKSGTVCERFWDEASKSVKIKLHSESTDPEFFMKWMDESGIDMAVLTTNAAQKPIDELAEMKLWNDFCARIVKKYPKRFVGFACIPATGGPAALAELERAVKELGMKGVHIWTRTHTPDQKPLDHPDMWPFYKKVSELNVPIDVHVTMEPDGLPAMNADYGLYFSLAREIDMCLAVMRICLGGVLEDFPNLVMIMNHFGGGVSSMIERVDAYASRSGSAAMRSFYRGKVRISKPWREYWDKLYFNMAGREVGMAAVRCALTNISPQKLVFGTDWPFNFDYQPDEVRRYFAELNKLGLSKKDVDDMLGNNAARILGLKS